MQCSKIFVTAAMLMFCNANVLANPGSDLYQVQISVKDRSNDALQQALPQALEQVLVKITGDPKVASAESVHSQLAEAQDYVERYEYLPEPGSASQQKWILQVQFSQKSVGELLQKNGAPQDVSSEEPISLHVYGINGLNDFSEVVSYVRALNSVTSVEATTVDSDDVILTVKTTGGSAKLKTAIAETKDQRLKLIEADIKSPSVEPGLLTYKWTS
jgi:hypothetical protein